MQHVSPMFDYKRRHDSVARYVWEGRTGMGRSVVQTHSRATGRKYKFCGIFSVQCDKMVEARRSIIILVDKQAKVAKIIKIAIPGDARVKDKEMEKIEKYQFLREEIGKLWKMKKVTVGPIVLGH